MDRPIRVCHLCSAHNANDDRVFARECVSLAEAGYEVHLFAVGKESEVYQRRGVVVHPLRKAASRRQRLLRRKHVARLAARLAPDLFHVHEPELLGPTIAVARSRPVIWDVHESYLDVIMWRAWIPQFLRRGVYLAWDWRERRLVRRCSAVLPVTEWIAKRYRDMGALVQVIANFSNFSEWQNLPSVPRDSSTCLYLGGIAPIRGLLEVVRAIGILRQRGLNVRLELAGLDVGSYVAELMQEADRLEIREAVKYHGNLSLDGAKSLSQAAGIGIVTYLPYPNHMAGWPTKIFQYMSAGLPLVYSDFPSYRKVVESCGAGIAVDPTDPNRIADAIARLVIDPQMAREMGEAGKRAASERFNWEREKDKLLAVYKTILEGPNGDRPG